MKSKNPFLTPSNFYTLETIHSLVDFLPEFGLFYLIIMYVQNSLFFSPPFSLFWVFNFVSFVKSDRMLIQKLLTYSFFPFFGCYKQCYNEGFITYNFIY